MPCDTRPSHHLSSAQWTVFSTRMHLIRSERPQWVIYFKSPLPFVCHTSRKDDINQGPCIISMLAITLTHHSFKISVGTLSAWKYHIYGISLHPLKFVNMHMMDKLLDTLHTNWTPSIVLKRLKTTYFI